MTHGMTPSKQGLYDPRYEHDSCGVGFVVDLKSRKSHSHRRAGLADPAQPGAPRRLRLREEHRRRRRHPRADAARLPGQGGRPGRLPPARARRLRRRLRLPADRRGRPPPRRGDVRAGRARGRTDRPRLARRAGRAGAARPDRAGGDADDPADLHWPRRSPQPPRRPGLRAQALRRPPPRRERRAEFRREAARHVLRPIALLQDADLQGDAQRRPARAVLPRPGRPGPRDRPGPGPLALQHQHLPQLGAGPPLPLHRPQRRDQHAARQRQLDDRPREPVPLRAVRAGREEAAADHRPDRQRLGHVRQRPGAARPVRPVAAARGHDDDPRAVGRRPVHERRRKRRFTSSIRA